tara:strand:+ start:1651 stop:1923 length:273 start_codon:yes stop_codon:yes gene_type:complete
MNNFIINSEGVVDGYMFEFTVAELFDSVGLPVADEYVVNWSDSDFDIIIDSVEADGVVVWQETEIDVENWTDDDDRLVEGLTNYVENNIV